MFEPGRQLAAAGGVAHDQSGRAGDDADPGYRQIPDPPPCPTQPAAVAWPNREEQLVVVAPAERSAQRVGARTRVPFARFARYRHGGRVELDADARRRCQLAKPVRQAVAEVDTARRSLIVRQLLPRLEARLRTKVPCD